MNPIRKRSNETYIIRQLHEKYEEIRTGCCNSLFVQGEGVHVGERIRFVEIDTAGRRTGRETFAEIEHIYGEGRHGKRLIKYRKASELRDVFRKEKTRASQREKAKRTLR